MGVVSQTKENEYEYRIIQNKKKNKEFFVIHLDWVNEWLRENDGDTKAEIGLYRRLYNVLFDGGMAEKTARLSCCIIKFLCREVCRQVSSESLLEAKTVRFVVQTKDFFSYAKTEGMRLSSFPFLETAEDIGDIICLIASNLYLHTPDGIKKHLFADCASWWTPESENIFISFFLYGDEAIEFDGSRLVWRKFLVQTKDRE